MQSLRDTQLRLEVRKRNWLRLEHFRRVCAAYTLLRRLVIRSLYRDAGVSRRQRALLRRKLAYFSQTGMGTRHSTRCRVTGRTHQALRRLQLARMQIRQQMSEGRLTSLRLGRS